MLSPDSAPGVLSVPVGVSVALSLPYSGVASFPLSHETAERIIASTNKVTNNVNKAFFFIFFSFTAFCSDVDWQSGQEGPSCLGNTMTQRFKRRLI